MSQDTLTFTLRLHDPAEKKDPKLSASWAVIEVPREDLALPQPEFIQKYVVPGLAQLTQLKPLARTGEPPIAPAVVVNIPQLGSGSDAPHAEPAD